VVLISQFQFRSESCVFLVHVRRSAVFSSVIIIALIGSHGRTNVPTTESDLPRFLDFSGS
jgi:hypothetical protein